MIGVNQKSKKVLLVLFGIFLIMVLSRITQAVPNGGYAHPEILIQPGELKVLIDKHTIVIYSDGPDNGRLWWILAYHGFPIKQLKLLDGGLDGWKAKSYPIEMTSPKFDKTQFRLREAKEGRKRCSG